MDQCEFLMHFSYNVVGFHTTSQCSKNEEREPKKWEKYESGGNLQNKNKKQKKKWRVALIFGDIIIQTS